MLLILRFTLPETVGRRLDSASWSQATVAPCKCSEQHRRHFREHSVVRDARIRCSSWQSCAYFVLVQWKLQSGCLIRSSPRRRHSYQILQVADAKGVTPLMHASEVDCDGITKLLLEGGADPTMTCQRGCLALHVSARLGVADVARTLVLEAPHALFDRTPEGETPLFLAAHEGQWRAVPYLLSVAQLHGVTFAA